MRLSGECILFHSTASLHVILFHSTASLHVRMDARDMRSAKELMIRLREARLVGWDNRRSSNTLVSVDEVMAVEAPEGSGCGFSCRSSCGSCIKSVCWLLGAVILFAATGEIIENYLNLFY